MSCVRFLCIELKSLDMNISMPHFLIVVHVILLILHVCVSDVAIISTKMFELQNTSEAQKEVIIFYAESNFLSFCTENTQEILFCFFVMD